jgi:hypothetical protein
MSSKEHGYLQIASHGSREETLYYLDNPKMLVYRLSW